MSLPDWLREAEESVTDGGIIAGPQARRLLPHDLRGIVGQDGRIAGFVCRRCSRVAWLNKGFADCFEADADVIQQLGESCEAAGVGEGRAAG